MYFSGKILSFLTQLSDDYILHGSRQHDVSDSTDMATVRIGFISVTYWSVNLNTGARTVAQELRCREYPTYVHICNLESLGKAWVKLKCFIPAYAQDVNLMMLMNAKERSLDEFKALGSVFFGKYLVKSWYTDNTWSRSIQAGLEFVRVWDIVESGIVEFKVAV
jgi:hypothetical protein